MKLDKFSTELEKIKAEAAKSVNAIGGAQVIIGSIEHESGHIQQALLNITDGVESGAMSEKRAIELMRKISDRIDQFSQMLLSIKK